MPHLDLRRGFLAASLVFAASIIAGWIFAYEAEPLLRPSLENLASVADQTAAIGAEFRSLTMAAFVFLKNLSVTAILVLVGHVVLALPAVFILTINGALIGLLARLLTESGLSPLSFIAGIAPHGIIELPALLLAAGFAFAMAARRLKTRSVPGILGRLGFLLRVIAPLLLAAAVIEIYITPLVLNQSLPGA